MNVNDLFLLWRYILGKSLQQGYGSPDDFNLLINQGSRSYAAYLLGSFQQYTPGRPVARVELGQNSVVRQRLAPIIYGYNLTIDSTGYVNFPGDYLQTDAMWSIYGMQRIRYADQHKLVSIYNSRIDPISRYPIYTLEDTGFRFYPTRPYQYDQAFLHYVRECPEMRWSYTLDENEIPVYDPITSVQPVWDSPALYEILVRALAIAGVNMQIPQVMQYSEQIKQSGQ